MKQYNNTTKITFNHGGTSTSWKIDSVTFDTEKILDGITSALMGAGFEHDEIYEAMYQYGKDHLPVNYFNDTPVNDDTEKIHMVLS